MESKTHWKKNFNYDYHGAYSLNPNQEVVLTIDGVFRDIVTGQSGQKEECTIVNFVEKINGEKKPMILNKTNCKVIEKLYGTPYIEDWAGKKIKLYVDNNVKAFGDIVDALRIRPTIPVTKKPVLDTSSPKWDIAKKKVKEEGMTFDQIGKHYTITQENYDLLCG